MSKNSWITWTQWTMANAVGTVAGIAIVLSLVVGLAYAGVPTVVVGIVGGSGMGVCIGAMQWLVVRRYITHAWLWIMMTLVGSALGIGIGNALWAVLETVVAELPRTSPGGQTMLLAMALGAGSGAFIGLLLGTLQWLWLREHMRGADSWVVLNTVGWMLAVGLSAGLVDVIGLIGSLVVLGLVSGAITGAGVLRLARVRWR